MKQFHQIAFVINAHKQGAESLGSELAKAVAGRGLVVKTTAEHPPPSRFLKGADLCCVIGGDGTLLSVVEQAIAFDVPVVAVNLGKLGFLATISPEEAHDSLLRMLDGKIVHDLRSALRIGIPGQPDRVGLNDFVIREGTSRLIDLQVSTPEALVNEYTCDGLVFSTPTGSTAYNLSAGGPIIHPESGVFVMTPICPHTLSNRAVIFSQCTALEVRWDPELANPQLSVDGIPLSLEPAAGQPLTIQVLPKKLDLIKDAPHDYFKTVRQKLNWG